MASPANAASGSSSDSGDGDQHSKTAAMTAAKNGSKWQSMLQRQCNAATAMQ